MLYWTIGIIVMWLLCALFTAGTMTAYYQKEYSTLAEKDYWGDFAVSMGVGLLFGPLALLVSMFYSGFWKYGWSLLPLKDKECNPQP